MYKIQIDKYFIEFQTKQNSYSTYEIRIIHINNIPVPPEIEAHWEGDLSLDVIRSKGFYTFLKETIIKEINFNKLYFIAKVSS